jgi:hypothetical protein
MKNFFKPFPLWWLLSAALLTYSILAPNMVLRIVSSIGCGVIVGNLLWEREQKRKKENSN